MPDASGDELDSSACPSVEVIFDFYTHFFCYLKKFLVICCKKGTEWQQKKGFKKPNQRAAVVCGRAMQKGVLHVYMSDQSHDNDGALFCRHG